MKLQVVDRTTIPSNYFLCKPDHKDDWNFIIELQYGYDFKYYYGTNYFNSKSDYTSAIELIKIGYDIICNFNEYNSNDPIFNLQQYYEKAFDTKITYDDCKKIYDFYKNNDETIKKLIELYDNITDDNEQLTESKDDDSDELKKDRQWFERELTGFVSNDANELIKDYRNIRNMLEDELENSTYDKNQAYTIMFEYVKNIAFKYVRDSGVRFEIDKRVITKILLDNVVASLLEDITYSYD